MSKTEVCRDWRRQVAIEYLDKDRVAEEVEDDVALEWMKHTDAEAHVMRMKSEEWSVDSDCNIYTFVCGFILK